jgi:nitric oxide reductase large subunit
MSARSFAAFITRVIVYVVFIGIAAWIAQSIWNFYDLDRSAELAALRAQFSPLLVIVPVICAILAGVARPLGVFAACYVVGAMLTAPFALLHAVPR